MIYAPSDLTMITTLEWLVYGAFEFCRELILSFQTEQPPTLAVVPGKADQRATTDKSAEQAQVSTETARAVDTERITPAGSTTLAPTAQEQGQTITLSAKLVNARGSQLVFEVANREDANPLRQLWIDGSSFGGEPVTLVVTALSKPAPAPTAAQ